MDALTYYVVTYYGRLMTPTEAAAQSSMHWEEARANADSEAMQRMITRRISSDLDVLQLLADGADDCLYNIRNRILRDNADKVFLNYCPRCQGLARTPWAKQCQHCFFSWHDPK